MGGARVGWPDFQLSVDELHFTSLLGSVPVVWRREEGSARWRGSLDRVGAHSWADGGPGNFRCVFQLFSGWEGLGTGVWVGGVGGGWVGVWGFGSPPATAGSFLKKKKKEVLDSGWMCECGTPVFN